MREDKVHPLMDAVRLMTLLRVQRLEAYASAIKNEGRLKVGADAHIAIFDPNTVIDNATYEKPEQPSIGVPFVLVNGTVVVRDGKAVGDVNPGVGIKAGARPKSDPRPKRQDPSNCSHPDRTFARDDKPFRTGEPLILVTTPTGRIGRRVLARLLEGDVAVRVIVRDPSRLDAEVRGRVQVVVGSHDDPAVLDESLKGVHGLFWLVPPGFVAGSAEEHYLRFARAAAEAIRRHGVAHVVAVSSAGHGWPGRAGVLSAAFAMDTELSRAGAAYRALSAPFFMENLLGQAGAIRERAMFSLANSADRILPMVATHDIADAAAALLADRSWSGEENVPLFSPDQLTPNAMAGVISDELGRPVAFRQATPVELAAALAARGVGEAVVRDFLETVAAVEAGIYDSDQRVATVAPTDFHTWCRDVLRPALLA